MTVADRRGGGRECPAVELRRLRQLEWLLTQVGNRDEQGGQLTAAQAFRIGVSIFAFRDRGPKQADRFVVTPCAIAFQSRGDHACGGKRHRGLRPDRSDRGIASNGALGDRLRLRIGGCGLRPAALRRRTGIDLGQPLMRQLETGGDAAGLGEIRLRLLVDGKQTLQFRRIDRHLVA